MHTGTRRFDRDGRGAVSIIFATAAIPLSMAVGLAIDYGFYIQAQSQLNLAADAGAIHAVRIASSEFIAGTSQATASADGAQAGVDWFNAQLGILNTVSASVSVPAVAFDPSTSTFTSSVTYTGNLSPKFAALFAVPHWGITGTSNAILTTNSYVEIDMLMDNSSSMLIGAQPADIEALQNLTVCPPTNVASATGHGGNTNAYSEYSWNFPSGQGFAIGQQAPSISNVGGSCWSQFTGDLGGQFPGDLGECIDPPSLTGTVVNLPTYLPPGIAQPLDASGYCPTGYGTPDPSNAATHKDPLTNLPRNFPQAPCGFACHSDQSPNDYWTWLQTARSKGAVINLRFDVIQAAAQQVVHTLQTKQQVANQFSLGVYTFNSAVNQVHPAPGGAFLEADNDLAKGLADIQGIATPAVPDQANTDFPDAMAYLTSHFTTGGDGSTPTTPRKNLFIVTDGLEDYSPSNRFIGQMTSPLSETVCAPLKAKGFNIYVLYTPYYPLPNPFYLTQSNSRAAVEAPITNASLSIAAGLQACASSPSQYYQASSTADINTALQNMLASALNSPGRLTY